MDGCFSAVSGGASVAGVRMTLTLCFLHAWQQKNPHKCLFVEERRERECVRVCVRGGGGIKQPVLFFIGQCKVSAENDRQSLC